MRAPRVGPAPGRALVLRGQRACSDRWSSCGDRPTPCQGAGGDHLPAIGAVGAEGEATVGGGEERALGVLAVDADGAAVADSRGVELREVQVGAVVRQPDNEAMKSRPLGSRRPYVARAPPMSWVPPSSAISPPSRSWPRRVMTLITAKNALLP